jgi:hypothetical protein
MILSLLIFTSPYLLAFKASWLGFADSINRRSFCNMRRVLPPKKTSKSAMSASLNNLNLKQSPKSYAEVDKKECTDRDGRFWCTHYFYKVTDSKRCKEHANQEATGEKNSTQYASNKIEPNRDG